MRSTNRIIGVIDHTWNSSHLYYARLASGACAKKHGYDVIAATDTRLLPQNRLAGVLYRYRLKEEEAHFNALAKRGVPMVMLNSPLDEIPSVNANFLTGTIEAIQHLKDLGRTKTAYIKGHPQLPTADDLFTAFRKALAHCGLNLQTNLIVEADFGYEKARTQTLELLRREPAIDSILCCSDRAAMGAIHAVKQFGARVPEDIAIIGLGNMPEIQEVSDHPLTTIADPLYFEAYRATAKLIDIINHRDANVHNEFLDTILIKRQTTLGSEYKDPILDASLSAESGSLDYLLSLGGSIEREARERLQRKLKQSESEGSAALELCEATLLEAVSIGFDANLAHDLIRQLNARNDQANQSGETLAPLESELYRISCNEITRYDGTREICNWSSNRFSNL